MQRQSPVPGKGTDTWGGKGGGRGGRGGSYLKKVGMLVRKFKLNPQMTNLGVAREIPLNSSKSPYFPHGWDFSLRPPTPLEIPTKLHTSLDVLVLQTTPSPNPFRKNQITLYRK